MKSYGHLGPVAWCIVPGAFWVRVFGAGFHVRNTASHPLRFSERTGRKDLWTFQWLR